MRSGCVVSIEVADVRRILILGLMIAWIGGLTACSAAAPHPAYRLAVIASGQSRLPKAEGLRRGLTARGYREGLDITTTLYNAENHGERLPTLLQQAMKHKPDVIVTLGGIETQTAKRMLAGGNVPLVFIGVADTVDWGVVDSFQHPGHNMTGIDNGYIEVTGKRLEYLALLLPQARRVVVLYSSKITPSRAALRAAQRSATFLHLHCLPRSVNSVAELTAYAASLRPGDADAILVVPSFILENALPSVLLPAAMQARIPVVGLNHDIVAEGAIGAYGASFQDMGYQGARLVDKVLRGVPAGNIPVEFPDKPQFSVNIAAATELGITMPSPALRLADRIYRVLPPFPVKRDE